ncbi:hypothetical protein [Caballeronia sp. LjRoot31]|uniref:hypothetical protein n=1 Tax=Caballeronia sp. LjRoot31 TaxID=3342324 RepID=UPI003ED11D7A
MTAILKAIWPALTGFVALIAAGVIAFVSKKTSDAKVAQANQQAAEARADVAVAQRQTAEVRDTAAQANATAAQAGAQAIKERRDVENDTAGQPDNDVRNELRGWASPGRGTGRNAAGDSADPNR